MEMADIKRSPLSIFDVGSWQPLHPGVVLLIAILLPGFGHVVCGRTRRGFVMQMFMISLAFVTWHLAAPDRDLVGKLAGGLFIYALSILEAYSFAKVRWLTANGAALTTPTPK
jgi:hypothetical protein